MTRVPKPAGDAEAGIEVEPMDPVVVRHDRRAVALVQDALGERVPGAVERRRDDGIGIAGRLIGVGQVDQPGEVLPAAGAGTDRPTRLEVIRRFAVGTFVGRAQRAAELAGCRRAPACRGPARSTPGFCTSISRTPTRGSTGFGTRSRTSVSKSPVVPVRKIPAVIEREALPLRARRRIPRRHRRGNVAEIETEAGAPARLRRSGSRTRDRPCSRPASAGRARRE